MLEWDQYRKELASRVHTALCDFDRYRGSENLMMTMGTGFGTIRPDYFLPRLLDTTVSVGAKFAVSALRHLLAVTEAKVESKCLIWGVEVSRAVKAANGLHIMPLPDDPLPIVLQRELDRIPNNLRIKSHFSILVSEFKVSPVVVEASECKNIGARAVDAYRLFEDFVAIACALGPGPVKLEQWWNEFIDPRLRGMSPMGSPSLVMQEPIPFPIINFKPIAINSSGLREIKKFLESPDSLRERLRGPLRRMNSGMSRRSLPDQALDCGIALEMLLGDEITTEIQYRLALRAALFLGTTMSERQSIRKELKGLYEIRSKIAHGSRKPIKGGQQAIHEGFTACASIIRKIVKRGSYPTWSEVELGSIPLK